MVLRPFRVGRNCDAWCTRCRAVTDHTIIALVGNLPRRVQCSACDGQHNYRDPNGPAIVSRGRSGPGSKRRAASTRSGGWQTQLATKAKSGGESRSYSTDETFQEGEVVDHASFGVGIVEKVLPGDKIKVLFANGPRLLVHNR